MNPRKIRMQLARIGKNRSWLSKEAGVSEGYLSRLFNNQLRHPGFTNLEKIAKALGVNIDQFCDIDYEKDNH